MLGCWGFGMRHKAGSVTSTHNIEARSRNHFWRGKTISVTYYECVCSFNYPVGSAHAPYCHLWPARLHHIWLHYLINGTFFGIKVMGHRMCFMILSVAFVLNISHSKKDSARLYHKCREVFMQRTRYSCRILMKLECCRQILENTCKILWKCAQWDLSCSMRTDRHEETNSVFAFRNSASASKNVLFVSEVIAVLHVCCGFCSSKGTELSWYSVYRN
jgi:hypothetical protein